VDPQIVHNHPEMWTPVKSPASVLVKEHHAACLDLFDRLIAAGVCREQARGVLPQNLYTEYYGTVNLNNLLKFIDLRTHDGAQWEIQQVAKACLDIATDLWPITVGAYRDIRHAAH
jgi:thymidylate synthase (FAD)